MRSPPVQISFSRPRLRNLLDNLNLPEKSGGLFIQNPPYELTLSQGGFWYFTCLVDVAELERVFRRRVDAWMFPGLRVLILVQVCLPSKYLSALYQL